MSQPEKSAAADGEGNTSSGVNTGSSNTNVAPSPPAASKPTKSTNTPSQSIPDQQHQEEADDMLLVTEFPPPPYYYTLASRSALNQQRLTPPEIPLRAFRVVAKRVALEKKRMMEESERIRLLAEGGGVNKAAVVGGSDDALKGETNEGTAESAVDATALKQSEQDDDSIDPTNENEQVVAVFGEIVEDPTLTIAITEEQQQSSSECNDPTVIRENVKRLNESVLRGFLDLVGKLVMDPGDNK
jgi:hypothetical protein